MTPARAIRVLYAEDDARDADLTRARLAELAPEVAIEVVGSGRDCLARLDPGRHDVLLLDQYLPDVEGLDVLRTLSRSGVPVPVVLVSGAGDEALVVKALRLGASSYVSKTGDYLEALPGLLRAVIAEHAEKASLGLLPAAPRRLLYIEHNEMDIELTARYFAEAAPRVDVEVVRSFAAALQRLREPGPYDAVLIDLRMPGESGLDFVRDVRRRGVPMPPFVMITGQGDEGTALASLKLGAADYVAKRDGYLDHLAVVIDRAIDRARVERLHAQLRRELGERERVEAERERLAAAVEQAAETIVIAGVEGLIRYVNPAFEALTGHARAEILGRHLLAVEHGGGEPAIDGAVWEIIASGKVWRGRRVGRKKDGRSYTEEGTISPVRDAAGVVVGYVAVKRDITEALALQDQLLQAQRMEGIGRLAGGVAHDFNNLLTVILTYTDFALNELPAGVPLRDDLLEARKAAECAAAMTRQLLAFSRKQVLQPVPFSLNAVADGMTEMIRRLLGEDVDFAPRLDADPGVVVADPHQIEQVIMNLVVNARDAMPGGGRLTLETSAVELEGDAARRAGVPPGPYARLAVADTGSGMDEATRARLFEPFFTTKAQGKGTGLGLSTVYGIVKQSGGGIDVDTAPGRGTTFSIYLPRDPSATPAPQRPPPVVKQVTGTETILVVEDAEQLRVAARRALEAAGYTVLTAADGPEAVQVSRRHPGDIHLLFTDVVMPRMSGRGLADLLARTRPAIRVLFTSGYTDDAIVHHGVLDPGVDFVGKPFTTLELTRKVREVLDRGGAPPDGAGGPGAGARPS